MKSGKHIAIALLLLTAATALLYLCGIGYGYGHVALHNQENFVRTHKEFKPEQLAITYQRTYDDHSDFLHFKIDTTYHKRGRANYLYEVVCDRKLSLSLAGTSQSLPADKAAECFIAGCSRKWYLNDMKREILGQPCRYASSMDGSSVWEAWYCDDLPHVQAGARVTDDHRGVILELRNMAQQYTLKAVNISQSI